jgi:glucuronate isomerase
MAFITDDFLLPTGAARRLYAQHAAAQPIVDYHSHLPPKDIALNRRFADLFEIWLEGDHYKWRAMRANGVDERFCTGDATPREKFLAWARTVPRCLRNPLYHWTHLELVRYFGITELLDERTAESIWERANARLREDALSVHGILRTFDVRVVCTTDDPADDLRWHEQIRDAGLGTRVYPTFRPDRALEVDAPDVLNAWTDRLETTAGTRISRFADLLAALDSRHAAFHAIGGRLSDHGLPYCYAEPCTEAEASAIFGAARAGQAADAAAHRRYASFMMRFFGRLDAAKGWTKQLHLGAFRNANTHAVRRLGRDTGYDSIGDWPQAEPLGRYLDALARDNALPKIILYNVNPTDNYTLATMVGNFQDGGMPGRMQFGSAWWFLDQKDGIEWQLDALSNAGLLSHFVGMLTDSRSFMSYPRHEYFRRVLCRRLGQEMESGELPADDTLVGGLVEDVSYRNASRYFGW